MSKAFVAEHFASLDGKTQESIVKWLTCAEKDLEIYTKCIAELKALKETSHITDAFSTQINFGTAGLRSKMGVGSNRMNLVTVFQSCNGIAKYLIEDLHAIPDDHSVSIGWDHRHQSKEFAVLAARIFGFYGFNVYLSSKEVPTPFVPMAVVNYGSLVGLMFTASHNPKEYNGMKLYNNLGCQIKSPADKNIMKKILVNLDLFKTPSLMSIKPQKIADLYAIIFNQYKIHLTKWRQSLFPQQLAPFKLKNRYVFTAMHGVGHLPLEKCCFEMFGKDNFVMVPSQIHPDPDFPTVVFPNPEETASLAIAVEMARTSNAAYVLAVDPDADRFTAAQLLCDGTVKFFTGNELGVMFLVYLMANRPKAANGAESRHHLQADGRNKRAMCCSRVSTKMPQVIGEIENIVCRRTLTGFKNLASESIELHNGGHDILMAFEESIGYMCDIDLPDKDGMSALNIFIGLVEHSAAGAVGFLQDIHQKYGYFVSKNSYFIIDDEEKRRTILPRLNDHFSAQSKSLAIGPAKVISVEYDAAEKILELRFDHLDAWICVRPSGTEPKVKVYTEAICKPPIGSRHPSSDMPTIAAQTDAFLEATTKAFLDSINLLL